MLAMRQSFEKWNGYDHIAAESSLAFYTPPVTIRRQYEHYGQNDLWDDDTATDHRQIASLFLPTPVTIRRLVLDTTLN